MNKKDIEALAGVRGAIRGWAFAPLSWIENMVAQAEAERDKLPSHLRSEADHLIEPVRKRIPQ